MGTTRYVVAALIGVMLIMGFDCNGDGKSHKSCDLRVKARYTDSLRPKFEKQLIDAKNLKGNAIEITGDSANILLGFHTPQGPMLPGPTIASVNDSLRGGAVSPDFTDAGVGNLISKAGTQGSSKVDCIRDQLILTVHALYPFEAPDPIAPPTWTCSMLNFCTWNMTPNQFEKWRFTDDHVKSDFIGMINVYSMWMGQSGHSGRIMIRNLDFGVTNNAPYTSVTFTTYLPNPSNSNQRNFIVTLND